MPLYLCFGCVKLLLLASAEFRVWHFGIKTSRLIDERFSCFWCGPFESNNYRWDIFVVFWILHPTDRRKARKITRAGTWITVWWASHVQSSILLRQFLSIWWESHECDLTSTKFLCKISRPSISTLPRFDLSYLPSPLVSYSRYTVRIQRYDHL